MSDQITSLLSDLQDLLQVLNQSRDKKEVEPIEGQIRTRGPDTVLASNLKNAIVSSPDEERIGKVNDLIIKADGNVAGVVISVGDDKHIALKLERFELTPQPDGSVHIMLSAKREELQQAPDFKPTLEQKPEEK
jgi:hypothetical protein